MRQFTLLLLIGLIFSTGLPLRADWSDDLPDPIARFDPRLRDSLDAQDDQGMAGLPLGLHIIAEAHYSFGTAVAPDGSVYFPEYNRMRLRKLRPDGQIETVVERRGGMYGVACDHLGNLFIGIDSDTATGKVIMRNAAGQERDIITELTRPRQITCDPLGNVYVVIEPAGQILKWDRETEAVTVVIDGLTTPQGVAVGPDGSVYFSQYSTMGGRGVALKPGSVSVLRPNGDREVLATGFWRARGIALHPDGDLYLATEANAWDQGNSGLLVRLSVDGAVEKVITGWDYPQFPAVGPDGRIYVTLGRDNKLVAYDPKHQFKTQQLTDSTLSMVIDGAQWHQGADGEHQIKLTIQKLIVQGSITLDEDSNSASIWLRIPASRLQLSPDEQAYHTLDKPTPGLFDLPTVSGVPPSGRCDVQVIPLRRHQRCRWPMNYETGRELPPYDFNESPVAFLVYLNWSTAD